MSEKAVTRPTRRKKSPTQDEMHTEVAVPVEAEPTGNEKYRFELEEITDLPTHTMSGQLIRNRRYAQFQPPASSGCTGKLFVPVGTKRVRILLEG